MKRPDSIEALLHYIAACLGLVFLLMGALCKGGVMQPSVASAVQDGRIMGDVFLLTGAAFCVLWVLLRWRIGRADALHAELLADGARVEGMVVQVSHERWMQFGHASPYRVVYRFDHAGREVRRKSRFVWDAPDMSPGDAITVYVNDRGDSAVRL